MFVSRHSLTNSDYLSARPGAPMRCVWRILVFSSPGRALFFAEDEDGHPEP